MTERPYTDDDLRAEAAKQLATLGEDPEFMCVGERMEGSPIESTEDSTWDQLNDEDFDTAQRSIDDLISNAADVSEWAVNLGADGLEPYDGQLTLDGDSKPIARIHFAFAPDMPEEMRMALVQGVGAEIARYL